MKWTTRVIIASAITLVIIGIFVVQKPLLQITVSENEIRANLTAIAEILTTVLAISVSLLLFSVQFVSEAYTPRVLRALFRDSVFLGYLVTYSLTIFVVEAVLTFNIVCLRVFAGYSYFALVFCVIYLLVLLFHMPSLVDPIQIITQIKTTIPNNFCELLAKQDWRQSIKLSPKDQVYPLEQILLRIVTKNDFSSFVGGLQLLESLPMAFLDSLANQIQEASRTGEIVETGQALREKPSSVFRYFLRIYSELISEAISLKHEWQLTQLCVSLEALMVKLHEIKSFRAFEWSSEIYNSAGLKGIDENLVAFLNHYGYQSLIALTKAQMKIVDEPIFLFERSAESETAHLEEKHLRSLRSILYTDFRNRLDFISEFARKAAEAELRIIVSTSIAILGEVLDHVLSLEPVERKRGVLTTLVMPSIVKTHENCLALGVNETTFTTGALSGIIENMNRRDIPEFGMYVARSYKEMAISSIRHGFWDEEYNWTLIAYSTVKNFPEIAEVAIDVIVFTLRTLKGSSDEKARWWYSHARQSLEGLRSWENHAHEKIITKIDEELGNFPPVT